MADSDRDFEGVLREGRFRAAHVAGIALGLVLAGFGSYTDSGPLLLLSGVAFAISGISGLMSRGLFWLSPRYSFLRYWGCLPLLGFGLVGIIEGVGRWVGWIR